MNEQRMTRFNRGKMVRFFKVVILIVLVSLLAQPVLAKEDSEDDLGVAPPDSKPYGKTYGQWTAEWWKYVMSFPADTSPLNDATGANCGVGQSGRVFFLVGTTGGPAERNDCVVPVGKSILFPVINFLSAVPEDGATADEIKALCSQATDYIDDVQVKVDGVDLQNLADYRFASPIFSFTGAMDNPYEYSCGGRDPGECYEGFHDTAFSDGYWVLLRPLPPGQHEIHFYGHFNSEEWGWEFEVDVTYHLTVANQVR